MAYLNTLRSTSWLSDVSEQKVSITAIELGSGCGIVGIGLAQMISNYDILLTDLPDAQSILKQNVSCSSAAKGSAISACVLDWELDLPPEVSERKHDMILVSDCTYNTDTIPALVNTLSKLTLISPKAVTYLATKVRHDSETEFFKLMNDASFAARQLSAITLPNLSSQYEGDYETVDIYEFRKG